MKREEWEQYQASLKIYRDLFCVLDTAHNDGLKEGMEKGKELGLQETS